MAGGCGEKGLLIRWDPQGKFLSHMTLGQSEREVEEHKEERPGPVRVCPVWLELSGREVKTKRVRCQRVSRGPS